MLKKSRWKFYTRLVKRWFLVSAAVGVTGGLIGSFFVYGVNASNKFWSSNKLLTLLLPIIGVIIVFFYHFLDFKKAKGTNRIIDRIRADGELPIVVGPLIFVSTILTHLFGGSAGREGAAVQIGGSIGEGYARFFKVDQKETSLIILSGVASVFAALFGTPIAAVFFALEVVSVGIMHYSGLVPCMIASIMAYGITILMGVSGEKWNFIHFPTFDLITIIKVSIIGIMSALTSVLIVISIANTKKIMERYIPNDYIRVIIGGIIIIILTFIFNSGKYNGSGSDVILEALRGRALPWDFALKLLFTSITLGAGFKGGEIVPVLFIGSTMGVIMGNIIGMDPGFASAVALVATFCGTVNSPVASIILAVELFGGEGIIFFAIACSISYAFSGYYSLYSSQKIVYSKTRAEYINADTKH